MAVDNERTGATENSLKRESGGSPLLTPRSPTVLYIYIHKFQRSSYVKLCPDLTDR